MFNRTSGRFLRFSFLVCAISFCLASHSLAQQRQPLSTTPAVREFPVLLEQNVIAGKTAVGTKIQAKLAVATLVDGAVIPQNALFSGEVVESDAKSSTQPSRLALRIDSEQWKNGSASLKLYLTAWYYPELIQSGQNLRYGAEQPTNRNWNGMGQYPDPNSPMNRPFPSATAPDKNESAPDTSSSTTSKYRVPMKDIASAHNGDGVIALISTHANIKLNKATTYVLATGELPSPEKK